MGAQMAVANGDGQDNTTPEVGAGGLRKNGKNWHSRRSAFRPGKAMSTFEQRRAKEKELGLVKVREAEMKAEKASAKADLVKKIRERRAQKEEKERWEKLEEKLSRKRVERLKRREKRNKMLNS